MTEESPSSLRLLYSPRGPGPLFSVLSRGKPWPISVVLFDLDNTLYPASSGMMQGIDTRITEYIQNLLGLDPTEAWDLRRRYFVDYGTTLHGLQQNHGVDADHYLTYVHDLALESLLASDAELDHLLSQVAAIKAIFTNAPGDYAQRVLAILGIERHFAHIFDIRRIGLLPKPAPAVYQLVLDALGVAGPRGGVCRGHREEPGAGPRAGHDHDPGCPGADPRYRRLCGARRSRGGAGGAGAGEGVTR